MAVSRCRCVPASRRGYGHGPNMGKGEGSRTKTGAKGEKGSRVARRPTGAARGRRSRKRAHNHLASCLPPFNPVSTGWRVTIFEDTNRNSARLKVETQYGTGHGVPNRTRKSKRVRACESSSLLTPSNNHNGGKEPRG